MYETFSDYGLPSSTFEDGRDAKSWKQMYWQNDKSQFDGATIAQLRQHFREWVTSQNFGGQLEWPETYMFMVVDKEVLDNIHPQNPEWDRSVRDEEPYLKAIDGDCPHDNEDIPGWMKVALVYLYHVYRKALKLESMRGLCLRDSDWFESETVSDEETYLEEDESDTSLDCWTFDSKFDLEKSET